LEKFIVCCIKKYNENETLRILKDSGINMKSSSSIKSPLRIGGGKFIEIGENTTIGNYAWIEAIENYIDQSFRPSISIGSHINIGNFTCITAIDSITIEDGCLISEHVYISDHSHGMNPSTNLRPVLQNLYSKGKVVIGQNTFIGMRVSILSGVTIGNNCIIGAHSVVNRSFPDFCMISGIPAKVIKKFNPASGIWEPV
jgi:lipopolysaccharide O-acetyltransferase